MTDIPLQRSVNRKETREVWWVNHKQTFSQEVRGDYIWSPTTKSNGEKSHFYENMKRVNVGDLVFSFANAAIQAVGVCTAPAVLVPKPSEFGTAGDAWANEGWMVRVKFQKLPSPVRPKNHMSVIRSTLPKKYSPIRSSGDGNQGAYLASIPAEMFNRLVGILGTQWTGLNLETPADDESISGDEIVERVIRNRTDIGETDKLQLVKARVGQGIYRNNLESMENACRVTGVTSSRHLRASHIIPWRLSNNFEKLDGNNGLLLSPHVDHLFDQGYITFTNDGTLCVSTHADADTLAKWSIVSGAKCGSFRSEQLPYLEFHREFIFKK